MNLSRVRPVLVVPALLAAALLGGCGGADEPSAKDPTSSGSSSAEGSEAPTSDLVTLEGEGFSIGLPTEATEQTQTVQTQAGPIEATYYSSEGEDGSFVVALTGLPANVEPNLDGAVDGAVKQVNGTLREKEGTRLLGYPAREARYVAQAGGKDVTVFARVVAVKDKLFQVQFVVEGKDLAEPPSIYADVLDSITLD